MKIGNIVIAAILFASASNSHAYTEATCPDGLLCASKPETIAAAMQKAGFRAKLDKDKTGDPMISSEASGYEFEIYFYGCEKAANCTSLQFQTSFVEEPDNTAEYANAWNADKRFIQASVTKQRLQLAYDVSTIGGLNQENFTDVTEWWAAMLGEFAVFVKEQKALSAK